MRNDVKLVLRRREVFYKNKYSLDFLHINGILRRLKVIHEDRALRLQQSFKEFNTL